MDKYKRLVSNTILFAISTFSSKILNFFLTTYHTHMMGTGAYGSMDAIIAIGNVFIPIVSLGISNAIIRFGLEKGVNKRSLYTNGLLSLVLGFVLLLVLTPLLDLVSFIGGTVGEYWPLLLVFVFTSCLRTLNCQFVRAREMVRLYAIDGILCTIANLFFNVLFLSGFQLGATGLILALICSDASSALFLFFVSRIWKYIQFGPIDTKLFKTMLRYSVPLISASIFWWVTNTSDKLFINSLLGSEVNGLFATSYRLPTLLTIVATLFTEAWQISAFTDGTRAGREEFFSRVWNAYQSVMFLAGSGIILLCQPIMRVYVSKDFYAGWVYIPLLTFATVFSSFDNFLNSIYMAEKRSGLSLATMAVGAVLNLILNGLLIPLWGVQGAAFATFFSYFVVFVLRAINTRGLIRVDFAPFVLFLNLALMGCESYWMLTDTPLWPVWCSLCVVLMAILNFQSLWDTARHVLSVRKRKQTRR